MKIDEIFLKTLIISAIVCAIGCTKKPKACFDSDKTKASVGEVINFTSCSSDAKTIEWNFRDGGNESGKNVSHIFGTQGTFNVLMTATSKDGKRSDAISKDILIKNKNQDFVGNYSIMQNCTGMNNVSSTLTIGPIGTESLDVVGFCGMGSHVAGTITGETTFTIPSSCGWNSTSITVSGNTISYTLISQSNSCIITGTKQ